MSNSKVCTKCKVKKDFNLFPKNKNQCRSCRTTEASAWAKKNREKVNATRQLRHSDPVTHQHDKDLQANATLKAKYGIGLAEYNVMLIAQNGGCKICGNPPKSRRLHVDHNHKTNKIRGLLCFRCNNLLVGIHTVKTARQVLAYLLDADGE